MVIEVILSTNCIFFVLNLDLQLTLQSLEALFRGFTLVNGKTKQKDNLDFPLFLIDVDRSYYFKYSFKSIKYSWS